MEYTIKDGTKAGAIEIYFSGKPDSETRKQLKKMRFYWNGKKLCWYGFHTAESVKAILENSNKDGATLTEEDFNNEFNVVASDGYLGAIETTGSKSGYLYGSELTKAIRKDFKRWNIKGVTVSVKTYSGGQSITVTITPNDGDLLTLDEYKKLYTYDNGKPNYSKDLELEWYGDISYYGNDLTNYGERVCERISTADFEKIEDETVKRGIFYSAIEMEYDHMRSGDINKHGFDRCKAYTEQFKKRFSRIKQIVDSYNHDDSNSMVDYFDRDFYETYTLKTA